MNNKISLQQALELIKKDSELLNSVIDGFKTRFSIDLPFSDEAKLYIAEKLVRACKYDR